MIHLLLGHRSILRVAKFNKSKTTKFPGVEVSWKVDIFYRAELLKRNTNIFWPGCEGDVADEETGLRRRPTVPTPGSASAAPTHAVAVAGVVVALGPRRAPAVSPPRAIAPARTPAAVAGHRSSRMLRRA
jgi:hypothetical protein